MRNCTLFFYGQNGFFVEVQFLDCRCFMFFVYETENMKVGRHSIRLTINYVFRIGQVGVATDLYRVPTTLPYSIYYQMVGRKVGYFMGLILPQRVKIKWTGNTRNHYESKGYIYTKNLDEFEVDVEDLTNGSTAGVKIKCDYCDQVVNMPYKDYLIRHKDKPYCCKQCLQHKRIEKDEKGNIFYVEVPYRNKEWLYNEYILKDRSASDIAKECGINMRSLQEWIRILGLTEKPKPLNNITQEELYDLYRVKRLSCKEIAQKYNVTDGAISYQLKKFGIPIYSPSEAINIYLYEKGGIEKARKTQSTMENRIKSSCKQRGIPIKDFNGFSTTEEHMARNNTYYKEWLKNVFNRDNYTCQCCGKRGGNLNAHHLYNFSKCKNLRYDVNNGITLCERCHLIQYPNSFHSIYGQKNNTPEQIYEFIQNYKEQHKEVV